MVCVPCMANAPAPTEIERGFSKYVQPGISIRLIRIFLPGNVRTRQIRSGRFPSAGYLFGEFRPASAFLESELFTNDKTFESRAKLAPDPKVRDELTRRNRGGPVGRRSA